MMSYLKKKPQKAKTILIGGDSGDSVAGAKLRKFLNKDKTRFEIDLMSRVAKPGPQTENMKCSSCRANFEGPVIKNGKFLPRLCPSCATNWLESKDRCTECGKKFRDVHLGSNLKSVCPDCDVEDQLDELTNDELTDVNADLKHMIAHKQKLWKDNMKKANGVESFNDKMKFLDQYSDLYRWKSKSNFDNWQKSLLEDELNVKPKKKKKLLNNCPKCGAGLDHVVRLSLKTFQCNKCNERFRSSGWKLPANVVIKDLPKLAAIEIIEDEIQVLRRRLRPIVPEE